MNDRSVHYVHVDKTYEPINVIQAWDLNFALGNVVKYVARYKRKHQDVQKQLEDLLKARDYLDYEIQKFQNDSGLPHTTVTVNYDNNAEMG